MKKVFYILIAVSLFQQSAAAQWVLQQSGTNQILYDLHFVNEQTGWVIGLGSTILKTTNGGLNWFQQQSNLSSARNLTGIDMLDVNTGYIVGQAEAILKTTNSGVNWIVLREMPVGQGNSYNDVDFLDTQTGWICGFVGLTMRTTNGGIAWDSSFTGNIGPLRNIKFVNTSTGWLAGDVGYLRKTTNGGLNWFFQFFGTTSDYWYNSLCFINENTGWVAGYNTIVFGTTDGGNNWDTLCLVNGICIAFINSQTGWTGSENGRMYKTTNGGYNWYQQTYPAGGGFVNDIYFINDTTGFSTSVFQILKTTNSGGPFVGLISNGENTPDQYYLDQNYPNPFNSQTNIVFQVFKKGYALLEIYNMLGQSSEILLNKYLLPGEYKIPFNSDQYPSGVYFYRFTMNEFTDTRKMIIIK